MNIEIYSPWGNLGTGEQHPLWKKALIAGITVPTSTAVAVGALGAVVYGACVILPVLLPVWGLVSVADWLAERK